MVRTLLLLFFLTFSIFSFGETGHFDDRYGDPPKVSIYPNPATNHFGLSTSEGIAKLTIFNLVGKEIRTFKTVSEAKYDISDLPNGMYLVQMIDENQKTVSTLRLQKR